jgi:Zn-dependent protease with chaperone function
MNTVREEGVSAGDPKAIVVRDGARGRGTGDSYRSRGTAAMRLDLIFLTLIGVIWLPRLPAETPVRNMEKERRIEEQLRAVAPAAVETFRQATKAMDGQQDQEAIRLYQGVLRQAADFSAALRRLGMLLAKSPRYDEALVLVEAAVRNERSPENLSALADVLAFPGGAKAPDQDATRVARLTRALALAKEANEAYRGLDDPSYLALVAQIALLARQDTDFREATKVLIQKYPDSMLTHYFHAILAAMDEDWAAADNEIRRAGQRGLPAEEVNRFLDSGVGANARIHRWKYYAIYVVFGWLAGLVLLFAAGKAMSASTLRSIERTDPNAAVSTGELSLRKYYRSLIQFAGFYYYFSLPFVMFLVIGGAGMIIYGFVLLGHIPIKLVAIIVIGALVTVYKMVQSLFIRIKADDPGRSLKSEEALPLWEMTREAASGVGTRPVDDIRVTPGTEMAVYERGSFRERSADRGRRVLVMGVGLLNGFSQNSLRAVLAHEYGHLSHRDTAGGDVALRVDQDMMKFANAMVEAGQAVWWNIAFQFLRVYHFLFRRITYGATRLQEILADRVAARIYGPQAFEQGLRHVVRRQIEFTFLANNEVNAAIQYRRALQNLYSLESKDEATVDEAVAKAIERKTTEDDTHPSPADRFRLVARVVCQTPPTGSVMAWELFANREALTSEMHAQIEKRVEAAITWDRAVAGRASSAGS